MIIEFIKKIFNKITNVDDSIKVGDYLLYIHNGKQRRDKVVYFYINKIHSKLSDRRNPDCNSHFQKIEPKESVYRSVLNIYLRSDKNEDNTKYDSKINGWYCNKLAFSIDNDKE